MPAFVVALLIYLFPKEVVAEMLIVLFKKLAASTTWTTTDDELVEILAKRFSNKGGSDGS